MNKEQAIAAMRKGKKVTHKLFMDYEYIYMDKDDNVVSEDGVVRPSDEFWRWRYDKSWEKGYSLFEDY